MSTARTYLDYNASAPLREEARVAVIDALDVVGNPSSVHGEGRDALRLIQDARAKVASYLGVGAREIVFTSGATESNNWVIRAPWDGVVLSAVEHDSVLEPAAQASCASYQIGVDQNGLIDLGALDSKLASLLERVDQAETRDSRSGGGRHDTASGDERSGRDGRVLVSVQAVNGETGVVQPLSDVRRILSAYRGALLHVDGVQLRACHRGLLEDARPDFVSLSAHKIGGPKGVGALFVRSGLSLAPMMLGGGQENRRRSGTQNVPGIAGFGGAAACAASEHEAEQVGVLRSLRDDIERGVKEITPGSYIVGSGSDRVCNTACICVPGVRAETLVMALDLAGVAISAGSACSSGKVSTSHVLRAMGLSREDAGSAVRVSLGWSSSKEDVSCFLNAWRTVMARVVSKRPEVPSPVRRQMA